LESISYQNEKIRRERVTLAEASPALNPIAGLAVKENSGLAGGGKVSNPISPELGKTFGF